MIGRRHFLYAATVGAVLFEFKPTSGAVNGGAMNGQLPSGARIPSMQFVYECDATLSEAQSFGHTSEGERRIIPITGGSFQGPMLSGKVLGGSYDWNLTRNDGGHIVDAAYFLRTEDQVMIRVVNHGVGGVPANTGDHGEKFFMFTNPVFEAPIGRYDWMNRAVFIATLGARADTKNAVLIRVFTVI